MLGLRAGLEFSRPIEAGVRAWRVCVGMLGEMFGEASGKDFVRSNGFVKLQGMFGDQGMDFRSFRVFRYE